MIARHADVLLVKSTPQPLAKLPLLGYHVRYLGAQS